MKTKKRFISIKYKIIGIFAIGIVIIMSFTFGANYLFFKNGNINVSFHNYALSIVPSVLVAVIIVFFISLWFLNRNVVIPINKLTSVTSAFAYDSNDKRKENIERIFNLKYHKRNDELGKLYSAIAMTTRESTEFADDILKQAETINKMQSGLLMVIAEMVDSRDEGTGSHIRKTKAYVEIIVNEMKKNGIYKEQLTDKFIYNTVNAAPLHDVGKIHLPDSLLLGTKRLTDEEYEIVKQHTVNGAKIIQYAIDKMGEEDAGYLLEAKNVALYHHEKWNGEGYPEGISGEQIPLSARIMAVADVFDAIMSKRSYKESIPFEESIEIIKKDSGTYFDPQVVDAFLWAIDEVKKIADDFEENGVKNL